MSWPGLPVLLRLDGRPVMLLGTGEAADTKRRLLERAGVRIVDETGEAALAIVAIEDTPEATAAVERLRARGVLVNAVDRPELCDFMLPAIVDREPVLVAISTGGASAGLAAALRQRIEALLPAHLGQLASDLRTARDEIRETWPDPAERRRTLAAALAPGGALDPLGLNPDIAFWLSETPDAPNRELFHLRLRSTDPDDLTLREARQLALADRVLYRSDVPMAILDRARADAERRVAETAPDPTETEPGLTLFIEMV